MRFKWLFTSSDWTLPLDQLGSVQFIQKSFLLSFPTIEKASDCLTTVGPAPIRYFIKNHYDQGGSLEHLHMATAQGLGNDFANWPMLPNNDLEMLLMHPVYTLANTERAVYPARS